MRLCCGVFTREDCSDMGLNQHKVFISWLVATLGVQDPSVSPSLSQGKPLSTKTVFWSVILQLIGTVRQKQNYRKQKDRLVHLEIFSKVWALVD